METIIYNKDNLSDSQIQIKHNKVKIVLENSTKEILLCKLNNIFYFVGGKMENGENIYDCAIRELKEETGISLATSDFTPFPELRRYQKNYYNSGKIV